jgi:hypothetical protein
MAGIRIRRRGRGRLRSRADRVLADKAYSNKALSGLTCADGMCRQAWRRARPASWSFRSRRCRTTYLP